MIEVHVPASPSITCDWLTRAVVREIGKRHPQAKSQARIVALKTSEGLEALDYWLTNGANPVCAAIEEGEQLELVLAQRQRKRRIPLLSDFAIEKVVGKGGFSKVKQGKSTRLRLISAEEGRRQAVCAKVSPKVRDKACWQGGTDYE